MSSNFISNNRTFFFWVYCHERALYFNSTLTFATSSHHRYFSLFLFTQKRKKKNILSILGIKYTKKMDVIQPTTFLSRAEEEGALFASRLGAVVEEEREHLQSRERNLAEREAQWEEEKRGAEAALVDHEQEVQALRARYVSDGEAAAEAHRERVAAWEAEVLEQRSIEEERCAVCEAHLIERAAALKDREMEVEAAWHEADAANQAAQELLKENEVALQTTLRSIEMQNAELAARQAELYHAASELKRLKADLATHPHLLGEKSSFIAPRRRKAGVEEQELTLSHARSRASHGFEAPCRASADLTTNINEVGATELCLDYFQGAAATPSKKMQPAIILYSGKQPVARLMLPLPETGAAPRLLSLRCVVDHEAQVLSLLQEEDLLLTRDAMWAATPQPASSTALSLALTLYYPTSYVALVEGKKGVR